MKKILYYDHKNVISQKVKIERKRLNISQEALAARLQTMGVNIDQQAISKIELNLRIVTDYEVICLAQIFGITTDELLNAGQSIQK